MKVSRGWIVLWRRRTEPVCGEKGKPTLGEGRSDTIKGYLLNRWILQLAHAVRKSLPSHVRKLEDKLAQAIMALEAITPFGRELWHSTRDRESLGNQ